MIEILETKDYNLLAEMNEEIQLYHHQMQPNIFKPYNREAVRSFFRTTLTNENAVALIAKEYETVLGYVLLFKIKFADNPFQYSRNYILIDQILVLEKYQLKGIGKQLLEATYTFAKSNYIENIELNHWTKNTIARNFFMKSGFEYYNEKMWKVIE